MSYPAPPFFRRLLWIVIGVVLVLLAVSYLRRQSSPREGNFKESGRERVSIRGVVIDFGSNPSGDVDKLALKLNGDSSWFHFPPHTAGKIMGVASPGSTVDIEFRRRLRHDAGPEYELLSVRSTQTGLTSTTEGVPPPPPRPGSAVTVAGDRKNLVVSPDSRARFFVLSGKRIVLPPRSAQSLIPLLRQGNHFSVTGNIRSESDGFVSLGRLPMVQAKTVRIDSVNYLVD